MPHTLHDGVKKYFITEEELNNGGQGRTPSRKIRHMPLRGTQ
jgi:hypothetical protein